MYSFLSRMRIISMTLLICISLTGCGNSPQPAVDAETGGGQADISYRLTELALPDSEAALMEQLWQNGIWQGETWQDLNWKYREESSLFRDGSWYLFSRFYIPGQGSVAACVQVLAPPYDHWESYGISHNWPVESPDFRFVKKMAGVAEDGVLLEVCYIEDGKSWLEHYRWDGTEASLLEIPGNLQEACWNWGEEQMTAAGGSRMLAVYDGKWQEQYSCSLTGTVAGILREPVTENLFPYGFERGELVLWSQTDGRVSSRITDQVDPYSDFAVALSDTGEILLADMNQAWIYSEESGLQELFSFLELEYPLDNIYGCDFGEDGTLLFYVGYDGEKYLLTAKVRNPAQETEKQEITFWTTFADYAMQRLAIRYNRQSEDYYVRFVVPDESEDWNDYRRRMQLEMAAGRGPDILSDAAIYGFSDSVKEYLEPLDGIVEDLSLFVEPAFEASDTDGTIYGISYDCFPRVLAVSRKITERTTWTLEEMMETIRASDAEVLEYGRGGVGIVMYYGLYDEENTSLIDWERGESHLTEQPFLDLLAFAREYADTGKYGKDEFMDCLADGKIAGIELRISNPGQMNLVKSCFRGEGTLIGYPRKSGNGIYLYASLLYMNRNASNKEGAADFLRYLLSEEGQQKYAEYGEFAETRGFVVRRSVNEQVLEYYQQSVTNPPGYNSDSRGYFWERAALDEEQIGQLWWLMDNAVSDNVRAAELWPIVEEELQPYFNGDRSAEQAAATLNSRVQLYLDERK